MNLKLLLFIITAAVAPLATASRVLELSDGFINIIGDNNQEFQWMIKFYAPWCAHCRRLEPVWAHVAQSLYNTPVKVAKVDCTRFPSVGAHFGVRAYPTIIFLKGNFRHEYNGERTKDEMVNYAIRMSQPPIQSVSHTDSMEYLKEKHPIYFVYLGNPTGYLWEMYWYHAGKYQPHSWFYTTNNDVAKSDMDTHDSAVYVFKDNETYYFKANEEVLQNKDALNATLGKWINAERFGTFPKITHANINQFVVIEKYIVLVIVSENKVQEISQTERDFKDMVESIMRRRKEELHEHFQFGWVGSPELGNTIAMTELSLPHLLVVNPATNHYYIPEDDPVLMTAEAVSEFIDRILKQAAPAYGGNSWPIRIYRSFFEARTTAINMWRGNPVLTALVFGLPLGFLSLICYSICCSDILDAEEEEARETHEKKD